MTDLKPLLQQITERLQPICIRQSKKKYITHTLTTIASFITTLACVCMIKDSSVEPLWLLGAITAFCVMTWESFAHFEACSQYQKAKKMHINLNDYDVVFHHAIEYERLTDAETDALLASVLSGKIISMLNEAISIKGYVTYADVAEMYVQQQKEEAAIVNHQNFVGNKHYRDPVQQQNLETILALNQPQQVYKSFNSRKVL